jgi:hypothetical protein
LDFAQTSPTTLYENCFLLLLLSLSIAGIADTAAAHCILLGYGERDIRGRERGREREKKREREMQRNGVRREIEVP